MCVKGASNTHTHAHTRGSYQIPKIPKTKTSSKTKEGYRSIDTGCLRIAVALVRTNAVHEVATLAALVRTNAAASSAWADYEAVFLDPATASFFEARLPDAKAALVDSESDPPSKKKKKKRKLDANNGADESPAPIVCEHCGGPVPQVSLRVASLDGTTLVVTVAQRGLVREVKRLVAPVRRGEFRQERTAEDTDCLALLCAVARHGPGLDRALCRRQGGRPA